MTTAVRIHFYDVEQAVPDKGWVHYTSRVPGWEGVDCRVADVVRDLDDVNQETVGFLNPPPVTFNRPPDPTTVRQLAVEAVQVSRFAPEWLDRIMTRSPFRDADQWRNDGKKLYLQQRRQRREKFLDGKLVFANPNQVLGPEPEGDGQHKHGENK
jgi:hypothetical protein